MILITILADKIMEMEKKTINAEALKARVEAMKKSNSILLRKIAAQIEAKYNLNKKEE
jgi:hypothetical protein